MINGKSKKAFAMDSPLKRGGRGVFFVLLFFMLSLSQGFTQSFAPKKFYLIDSLNLASLNKDDRQLIDSCLTLYHKAKDDTTKINALSGICENMMDESWYRYQFFQYELINKIVETHHKKLVSKHLKKSLAFALSNIGYIYNNQGNIPKALEHYGKSLQLQEEIGDKQGIATSLNNIGLIYQNQGDIPNALEYLSKSMQLIKEIGDKRGIANSLNNIGSIYHKHGDPSVTSSKEDAFRSGALKALEYHGKSLQLQEEIGNKVGIANSLNNIGFIYDNQGDLRKALEYYSKSLQLKEEIGDKQGIANSLTNIGFIYLAQHQLTAAKNYYEKAYQLSKELGYPKIIDKAASGLKRVYEQQGNFKLAYHYHQEEIQMRDSIQSEENYKASVQQRAKYEYEKKAATDSIDNVKEKEIKNAEIAEQKAEIKAKRLQQYGLIGGLAIVLIFAGFVYNRLKVTQQQKRIIEKQKTEVEQQKQLVEKQKEVVEEKQNEILASIRYAKRIQDALLTSQTYIERNITRLRNK